MKTAVRSTIVVACIALVMVLLYPPWMDGFSKKWLGFHFISGADLSEYSFSDPKIDYMKLLLIEAAICIGSVAAYFMVTSGFAHNATAMLKPAMRSLAALLGRLFKPLGAVFTWLEKYWLSLVFLAIAFKLVLVVLRN